MKRTWITANVPNCEGCLVAPIGVPNVLVPLTCIATDKDKLIYVTSDRYDGCLHQTQIVENPVGDFFVYGLFVSFRPWAWDNQYEITEFSHLKIHVNKSYGCYVNTDYGRVYINSIVAKYFDKKGVYECKKYNIVKTQGGKFGCFIPKNGKYN